MRILVTGGRSYDNVKAVLETLGRYAPDDTIVIHGAAMGADSIAEWACTDVLGIRTWPFSAPWFVYGRRAGAIRNGKMLAEGKPDLVIAFPGGKGTADMIRRSVVAGVSVKVVDA